jgi:hypothetical protein
MSWTTITITKFNSTNYAQWATKAALLLEQKQVYSFIKGYNEKTEEPTANSTATEKAAFKYWMNSHGVTRYTILLGIETRIHAERMVVEEAMTHSE